MTYHNQATVKPSSTSGPFPVLPAPLSSHLLEHSFHTSPHLRHGVREPVPSHTVVTLLLVVQTKRQAAMFTQSQGHQADSAHHKYIHLGSETCPALKMSGPKCQQQSPINSTQQSQGCLLTVSWMLLAISVHTFSLPPDLESGTHLVNHVTGLRAECFSLPLETPPSMLNGNLLASAVCETMWLGQVP